MDKIKLHHLCPYQMSAADEHQPYHVVSHSKMQIIVCNFNYLFAIYITIYTINISFAVIITGR